MTMTMREIAVIAVAAFGVLIMLISTVGILRLPGVHARMHAVGKGSTLGISCLLLSAGLYFGEGQLLRMIALIALFFVTSPIATTAIARAAYRCSAGERAFLVHNDMSEVAVADTEINSIIHEHKGRH
jgi:multicomponent Na+:H+ antiporter subunit G